MSGECQACIDANGDPDPFICDLCIGPDTPSLDLPIERYTEA